MRGSFVRVTWQAWRVQLTFGWRGGEEEKGEQKRTDGENPLFRRW